MRRIFLAMLLIFMMSAATALAANWQQIYTDQNDDVIYFDTDSVKISAIDAGRKDTTFSAVYRMDYSDRGRQALIDWYRDYSIMPADIGSLSYSVSTVQFRREGDKRYYYIAERISYTANGTPIADMHYVDNGMNWQEIPVGSEIDVEYFEAKLIVDGKLYKRIDAQDL